MPREIDFLLTRVPKAVEKSRGGGLFNRLGFESVVSGVTLFSFFFDFSSAHYSVPTLPRALDTRYVGLVVKLSGVCSRKYIRRATVGRGQAFFRLARVCGLDKGSFGGKPCVD